MTLAGAAEDMIDRKGLHLYDFLMNHHKVQHVDKKEWRKTLNEARDWLKHVNPGGPDKLEIGRRDACTMIARAASKLEADYWTGPIDAFRQWYIANIDEVMK